MKPGVMIGACVCCMAAANALSLSTSLLRIALGDAELDTFEEDGLYALPFEQFRSIVPSAVAVPWRNLRIYTGPADTLDQQVLGDPVSQRLREVPVFVRDNGNQIFDAGDTLLFWGQGSSRWTRVKRPSSPGATGNAPSAPMESYVFSSNPFSLNRGYLLDFDARGDKPPLRLSLDDVAAFHGPADTAGYAFARAQRDLGTAFCDPSDRMDSAAGVVWHWHWRCPCDSLHVKRELTSEQLSRPHLRQLPGALSGPVALRFDLPYRSGRGDGPTSGRHLSPTLFGRALLALNPDPFAEGSWQSYAGTLQSGEAGAETEGPMASSQRPWDLSLRWTGGGERLSGYTVRYLRSYAWRGTPLTLFPFAGDTLPALSDSEAATVSPRLCRWRLPGAGGKFAVRISEGLGTRLFRLDSQGNLSDTLRPGDDVVIVVVAGPRTLSAAHLQAIAPPPEGVLRDFVSGDTTRPDYLFVAPAALIPAAQRLAEYRRSTAGGAHRVALMRVEDIFDRYAGGRREPAALRDGLRWAHHHWNSGASSRPLSDVLLLGDGHFDVRGLRKPAAIDGSNPIPPFIETNPNFASDDLYAFGGDSLLFNIGRLPFATAAEVDGYVAKIRDYENPANAGAWRGRLLWAADDQTQHGKAGGDIETGIHHTADLEGVYRSVNETQRGWQHSKILLLDYAMNPAFRKPEASQDLVDRLNQGALMLTYFGHGAFNQWADEVLAYTNETVSRLRNVGRLSIVNSFSCTVGRFDNGANDVWTERLVRQSETGAIAGISATRETYSDANRSLAIAIYSRLLRPDSSGGAMSLGEASRAAKNSVRPGHPTAFFSWINSMNYVLMGEPVLKPARDGLQPSLDIVGDTLRALQCGSWEGRVEGGSGEGHVQVTVAGSPLAKTWTVGDRQETAELPGRPLFSGGVEYHRGRFRLDYVLPLQIPFGDSLASITLAANDKVASEGGKLWRGSMRLEGVTTVKSCPVQDDGRGPRIAVTGCEESETGVSDLPEGARLRLPYCLLIRVTDSIGGIQSGEGPDEGTVLSIPGAIDPFHPIPGIDELQHKEYRLPLRAGQLKLGKHALQIMATDAYGHRSMRAWDFEVGLDTARHVLTAFNLPNPVKAKGTTFYFAALLPADDGEFLPDTNAIRLLYTLSLYDQHGRVVMRRNVRNRSTLEWNGRDDFDRPLANGVYFYTVSGKYDPGFGGASYFLAGRRNTLVLSR